MVALADADAVLDARRRCRTDIRRATRQAGAAANGHEIAVAAHATS